VLGILVEVFTVVTLSPTLILALNIAAQQIVFVFASTVLAHFLFRVGFTFAVLGNLVLFLTIIALIPLLIFALNIAAQ
jgi:hypothetical protein